MIGRSAVLVAMAGLQAAPRPAAPAQLFSVTLQNETRLPLTQ